MELLTARQPICVQMQKGNIKISALMTGGNKILMWDGRISNDFHALCGCLDIIYEGLNCGSSVVNPLAKHLVFSLEHW